jgi:hypothetical protein
MAWTGGATWPISVYLIVLAGITFLAATVERFMVPTTDR